MATQSELIDGTSTEFDNDSNIISDNIMSFAEYNQIAYDLGIPSEFVDMEGFLSHQDTTSVLDWVNWGAWENSIADVSSSVEYQQAFTALVDSIPETQESAVEYKAPFNFEQFGWNQFETETTDYQFQWYGDNVVVQQFLNDDPDIIINQVELTHEQYNLIQDNGGNPLELIGVIL